MNHPGPASPPIYYQSCTILLLLALTLTAFAVPNRPNLLIIQTDEHHYGTLGCYGGEIVKTPNIDWLAKNGARATSFYATTPVCSPSRSAFVSGRYPQNTGVPQNDLPMRDDIVTFAELLVRSGYKTGYAGKWHLDGEGKPQWGPARQFGFQDNRFMYNRGHWKKMEDGSQGPAVAAHNRRGEPSYDVDGADETSFTTDWLSNKAIDFIQANKEHPFCYMVSLPDPHGPNTVRKPYDAMYSDVKVPIPTTLHKTPAQTPGWAPKDTTLDQKRLAQLMPAYYGMVKCIDDNVGRILDTLRSNQILENTVIVFTSDHGDLCGEHGRLNKGVPYEGSAKIPFLLFFPGVVKPGTQVDEALSCVDFLPTVLNLMKVPTAGQEQGRDASALFTGGDRSSWDDISFLRGTLATKWLCVVTRDLKLVYSSKDNPWLFDLRKDPYEVINFYSEPAYRQSVFRLTSRLKDYARERSDPYITIPQIKEQIATVLGSD